MQITIVGTCGNCGGMVTIPTVWYGTITPLPTCQSCHATARIGPVLPMNPAPPQLTHSSESPYEPARIARKLT